MVYFPDMTPEEALFIKTLPLSSTVVIEDENGDGEALKSGTEKAPADA